MENNGSQIAGTQVPNMRSIEMDLSHATARFSSLFFIFTELWLMCHCKSPWYMEQNSKCSHLKVCFQDPREAILFKLSRQFDAHYAGGQAISFFANLGSAYV